MMLAVGGKCEVENKNLKWEMLSWPCRIQTSIPRMQTLETKPLYVLGFVHRENESSFSG